VRAVATVRKSTLSDVARRAGVSATTASYILNGRSAQMRIATTTQDRVLKAAAELHYRPNPSARSLRTSTTRTVGVISDLVAGGSFASQMLTGASAAARMLAHLIVIGESQGDPQLEALLVEEMLDRHVDGIIYATMVTSEVSVPRPLRQQRVVLLNCVDRATHLPAVLPDEYEGGRTAVAELLAGEVPGPVHVVGETSSQGGSLAGPLRVDGIKDALREAGRELAGVLACAWDVEAAFDVVDAFLRDGRRPSGLICLNDRVALGTFQALAEHGLHVPGDVSVVSFDGSELAGWLRPRLTSVAIPYADLGARAVEMLLDTREQGPSVVRVPMPVARGRSVLRAP
jgi:LacI family transcriptional regulator